MKKSLVLFLLLSISLNFINAQEIEISGQVNDEFNQPLIGASVLVVGTPKGTITDIDGKYKIVVPSSESSLEFKYVAYVSQTIKVGEQTSINVQLKSDVTALSEVVVTGYGTQNKKDLSSAITVVSAEELTKRPTINISSALQGLAPGVNVVQNGGAPGADAKIHIRGVGSPNDTDPLYVIDGVPTESSATINPNDIESMQILKDAASTAIYGSRGANGVIVITTKSGKSGKTNISFESSWGIKQINKRIDLLTAKEYVDFVKDASLNNPNQPDVPITVFKVDTLITNQGEAAYGPGTDWQDALFRDAPQRNYNLNFSGGSELFNYNASLGYTDEVGTMVYTNFKKYNMRLKTQLKKGRFDVGQTVALSYSTGRNNGSTFNVGGNSMPQLALTMPPTHPIYFEGYDTIPGRSQFYAQTPEDGINLTNPIALLYYRNNVTTNVNVLTNLYADIELLKGMLNYRISLNVTANGRRSLNQTPAYDMGASTKNLTKDVSESYSTSPNLIGENYLTFKKEFGIHNLNIVAGASQERSYYRTLSQSFEKFPSDHINTASGAEIFGSPTGERNESYLMSYYGRLYYNLMFKYYFTAIIRRDGSSKFSKDNHWGNFPSFSVAWKVGEEEIIKQLGIFDNFKIRGSYGVVGNQRIGNYQFETTLNKRNYNYNFGVNGAAPSILTGRIQQSYPNSDAKWESTITKGIGADIDLFSRKLGIVFDWYLKETSDLLLQVPIPTSTGNASNNPYMNAGAVKNLGYEIQINHNNKIGEVGYGITGNISFNSNEVTKTSKTESVISSGTTDLGQVTRMEVGKPIGYFKGYKTNGVFSTQKEIDDLIALYPNSSYYSTAKPGDIRYVDLVPDGNIDTEDMTDLGNPFPDYDYSINARIDWKFIDFSIDFQGIHGNEIFSELKSFTQSMNVNTNQTKVVLDRWKEEGDITNIPRAELASARSMRVSDLFIEDGSYTRLKSITIGFTLPSQYSKAINVENFRIYFQGQNLYTWTNYSMFDPEVGYSSDSGFNLNAGIDVGSYPVPSIWLMGLQLTF